MCTGLQANSLRLGAAAVLVAGLLIAVAAAAPADAGYAGTWVGEARAGDEHTTLILALTTGPDGPVARLSLPEVGVSGWPASSATLGTEGLRLSFPSDSGPQVMTLTLATDALTGSWHDPRFGEPARLTLRHERPAANNERRMRVAGPVGPLGVSVLLPPGRGPFTGIVLVHGSGPESRATNRAMAESLVSLGIAAAIFDKRGVGESGGDLTTVSITDLAADAVAVAAHLDALPEVAGVGIFGHSQGGWVAPLAAYQYGRAAFVITSAGPAVPPSREAEWDTVRQLRRLNAGSAAEIQARAAIQAWHDGIRSGNWLPFDQAIDQASRQTWYEASGLTEFTARPPADFQRSYRRLMDYDPLPTLERLNVPMLALLSADDESIDALETVQILQSLSAAGRPISVRVYNGFDHSMRQLAPDGSSLRWPTRPGDYFEVQAEFIRRAVAH
jgi:alpha-beta hydrolase superfamily lysophospholipase